MGKGFPLLAIFLGLGLWLNVVDAEQQTVVLQVNESAPIWSEQLPLGGMGGEIVQAISNEMGLNTRIEFIPLKRLIADFTNNDIGNPLFYMENQEFAAIIPIAISYSAFFSYNQDIDLVLTELETKPKRIGLLQGTLSDFITASSFGHFEESSTQDSLFKKLKSDRLDLVIELNLVGLEKIKRLFPNHKHNFNAKVIPHSGSPVAIMIDANTPNAKTLGMQYQEGLSRIIKNGVYQQILEKYHQNTSIPSNWHTDLLKFSQIYSLDFNGHNL